MTDMITYVLLTRVERLYSGRELFAVHYENEPQQQKKYFMWNVSRYMAIPKQKKQ